MVSRPDNDPPGQTAQHSTKGHTEVNSPSDTQASEHGGQLPTTITLNESPDNETQVDHDEEDAATAVNAGQPPHGQGDLDAEGQRKSHPVETVDDNNDDKDKDTFINNQGLPQANWSDFVQGNTMTTLSITPQEVDVSAIQCIREQRKHYFEEFTSEIKGMLSSTLREEHHRQY